MPATLYPPACFHPLQGKRVVVVGAGGAGRALAFGAAAKGAGAVIIANRNRQRGDDLAAELAGRLGPQAKAQSASLDDVAAGAVGGDVLVNTTAVGMHPKVGDCTVRVRRVLKRRCMQSGDEAAWGAHGSTAGMRHRSSTTKPVQGGMRATPVLLNFFYSCSACC